MVESYLWIGFWVWLIAVNCVELSFEQGMLAFFGWPLYVGAMCFIALNDLLGKYRD